MLKTNSLIKFTSRHDADLVSGGGPSKVSLLELNHTSDSFQKQSAQSNAKENEDNNLFVSLYRSVTLEVSLKSKDSSSSFHNQDLIDLFASNFCSSRSTNNPPHQWN